MTTSAPDRTSSSRAASQEQISLVDLLDRLLGSGVVLTGDVVISLAGVDLVQVSLRALITSVRAEMTGTTGAKGTAELTEGPL